MRYSKRSLSNLSEYDKDLLNNKFDLTLEIDKRNDNVFIYLKIKMIVLLKNTLLHFVHPSLLVGT